MFLFDKNRSDSIDSILLITLFFFSYILFALLSPSAIDGCLKYILCGSTLQLAATNQGKQFFKMPSLILKKQS